MTIRSKWYCYLLPLILWLSLFITGCQAPDGTRPGHEVRTVTDCYGTEMVVPVHPERVVSVGVSTDDVLIPLLGTKRIVAIAELMPNLEKESEEIKGRISGSTESVLQYAPDLVVVPSWKSAEYVDEIRSAGIPVYVYQMPVTTEKIIGMIHELADLVGEPENGNRLAQKTEDRIRNLHNFLQTIPEKDRLTAVLARPNGIGGGSGSTFDTCCKQAGIINGAAAYGLSQNDSAGRETLLSINPDIIFVPSDAYSEKNSQVNAMAARQIYEDPAFSHIKAVQNHQIYIIDARWLMSYSQFIVNAMEEMAKNAYGYEAIAP